MNFHENGIISIDRLIIKLAGAPTRSFRPSQPEAAVRVELLERELMMLTR